MKSIVDIFNTAAQTFVYVVGSWFRIIASVFRKTYTRKNLPWIVALWVFMFILAYLMGYFK